MYTKYDELTDSKIKWIGEMPAYWEKSKFKHNFTFSKAINTSKNPVILSLTLQGIKIRDISTNEGQIASSYDNYTKVFKNDIVLNPMDLISGFVDCSPVEGVISPAYYTLKPNKDIDSGYYKYYLQKHYYEQIFFPFAEGVSVDHRWTLKKEDFLNFSLIKPPIDEQKQIANYLDKETSKIDETIAKNEELIQLLEEKRIALINQAVTKGLNPDVPMKDSGIEWIGEIPEHWEIEKLKKYFSIYNGSTPKDIEENWGGDICWITPADYKTSDIYINNSSRQITKVGLNSCGTHLVPKGSIIVSNRAPIGSVAIANRDLCTNQGCKSLVIKRNINTKFVYYVLSINENELNRLGRGTTFMELSSYDLGAFQIPVAPFSEQKNIVEYLDNEISKLNSTIHKINKNINLLEEYKTSLIHHVVTGKVDVRGEEI